MPAFMNYDSLIEDIKSFCNRSDDEFTSQIPKFIDRGIGRIFSEAKNIGFEKVLENTINQSVVNIEKPIDWKETISLKIENTDNNIYKYLWLRTHEFCRTYWPDRTQLGVPEFYSDFNAYNSLTIVPTPDVDYRYILTYLSIPIFNEFNQTNFLTRRYPRLLFYACALEAIAYLRDDKRIAVIENLYNKALSDINLDTQNRKSDRVFDEKKD